MTGTAPAPDPRRLEQDDAAWDAFVAAGSPPAHLQSSAWAAVKRPNGWRAVRVAAAAGGRLAGGQVLYVRPPGSPWGIGYLARGPVTADGPLDPALLEAFLRRLRAVARERRLALVRIEPEFLAGDPLADRLAAAGLHRVEPVQPDRSSIIDLRPEEEAILAAMHRKCRQSVTKSARLGVRIAEVGGERIDDVYAVHADAMRRAGIVPRSAATFRSMWEILAPRGMARLFLASGPDAETPVAALFLVRCGDRAVDLYGGTTAQGGALRANYLLKWEAIRAARAAGCTEYDLWGLPRSGIEQFKSGFGGRETEYVGAWEMTVSPFGAAVVRAGERARATVRRIRYRKSHRPDAPDAGGEGADRGSDAVPE